MTSLSRTHYVGRTATALATLVRTGEASPVEIVRAHLDRIDALDPQIGAFQLVRREKALTEAKELAARADLHTLPLAGVPVAIKDNLAVAGEPLRNGSAATPETASDTDHETVRRLRAAGAIVVGKTRLSELGVWGTTDSVFGVTHNPWSPARSAGGSSGGSAAAVAAGMVPLALGNDGLGSIRIPAAACGIFGMKPGSGLVPEPSDAGISTWFGMTENGPLATTVEDAALMLSVLADRPDLCKAVSPDRPLHIALSTRSPALGIRVDPEYRAAAMAVGELLEGAGHRVEAADPPFPPMRYALAIFARWFAGTAEEAEGLPLGELEPRTQRHVRLGGLVQRWKRVRPEDREGWRRLHEPFFSRYDLLLTPALAAPPPPAVEWSRRSWIANLYTNLRFAPFAGAWNFAGYPAAALPAGMHSSGMPLSVQLVAREGNETLLLSAARQLEELRPWLRHAPLAEGWGTADPSLRSG